MIWLNFSKGVISRKKLFFISRKKNIFKNHFFLITVIKGDRIDATPGFYTYDASKIRVGEIPPGLVGMPVEFQGEYIL